MQINQNNSTPKPQIYTNMMQQQPQQQHVLTEPQQSHQIVCQPQIQQQAMSIYPQQNTNLQILPQPIIQMPQPQASPAAQPARKDPVPTLIVNSNTKYTLPKVGPNQQIFSFNTLTNQITQLSGLTTAALSPMERLLIVPSGINAQQLAQCLIQGQIQFNNTGQAVQTTDAKANVQQTAPAVAQSVSSQQPSQQSVQQQQQQQQQHINVNQQHRPQPTAASQPVKAQPQQQVHQTPSKQVNQTQINEPGKKVAAEAKPRKSKAKKAKTEPNKASAVDNTKGNQSKAAPVTQNRLPSTSVAPTIVYSSAGMEVTNTTITSKQTVAQVKTVNSNQPLNNVKHLPPNANTSVVSTHMVNTSTGNTTTNIINIGSNAHMNNVSPIIAGKSYQQAVVLPSQQEHNFNSKHQTAQIVKPMINTQTQKTGAHTIVSTAQSQQVNIMPPLISVSSTPSMAGQTLSRVQTIQLTAQKQQSLKNVQNQIKILSARIQNKSLLTSLTVRPDLGPSNPLYNKPLPSLANLNAMSDMDMYHALQRLFIEQQKIIATGKIIPTLPTGPAMSSIPMSSPNVTVTPVVSQPISVAQATPSINVAKIKQANAIVSITVTQNQPVCVVPPQQQQVSQTSATQAITKSTTSTVTTTSTVPQPISNCIPSIATTAVEAVIQTQTVPIVAVPVVVVPTPVSTPAPVTPVQNIVPRSCL